MANWSTSEYDTLKAYLKANHVDGDTVADVQASLRSPTQVGWQAIPSRKVRAWLRRHELLEDLEAAAVNQQVAKEVRETIRLALMDLVSESEVFDFSDTGQLSSMAKVKAVVPSFTEKAKDELLALAAVVGTVEQQKGLRNTTAGRIERALKELGWSIG